MAFHGLEESQDILERLQGLSAFTIDELFDIVEQCQSILDHIDRREQAVVDATQPRSLRLSALDLGGWFLGILGFLVGIADFFVADLSPYGWAGLLIGWIGLVVAATLYQLRRWELDDFAAELAGFAAWRTILEDVLAEVERRLSLV
jgi:uncharacterized membrane-anchored protein